MTSLIESLCNFFQCKPLRLHEILKHPHKREQVRKYLEGQTFRTTYLENNHNVKFGNLTIQGSDKLFAYEGYLGVTVQQHYYCRHRIRICHACLPCVIVYGPKGHKSYYPLELISMEESGYIPTDYLQSKSLSTYCASLSNNSELYRGFQFVGLERDSRKNYRMVSLVNRFETREAIKYRSPGYYGFGNSPYDIPFLKVRRGEEKFQSVIQRHLNSDVDELIDELLNFVQDPTPHFPDNQLKSQTLSICKAEDDYKYLSSLFVRNKIDKEYGSRSHSVILIDRNDQVTFHETRLADKPNFSGQSETWECSTISFSIA